MTTPRGQTVDAVDTVMQANNQRQAELIDNLKKEDDKMTHLQAIQNALGQSMAQIEAARAKQANELAGEALAAQGPVVKPFSSTAKQNQAERDKLHEERHQLLAPYIFPAASLQQAISSPDINTRLAAITDAGQFSKTIDTQIASSVEKLKDTTLSKQARRDIEYATIFGCDQARFALHYAFPKGNMTPAQITQLAVATQSINDRQTNFIVEHSSSTFGIDIMAKYAANPANDMKPDRIENFQIQIANELALRNTANVNYPISPKDYDNTIKLLNDMENKIPDGPERDKVKAANDMLRQNLGSKLDRMDSYLNAKNPGTDHVDRIKESTIEMKKELSGLAEKDNNNDDLSTKEKLDSCSKDIEMLAAREQLVSTMEKRLAALEKSLETAIKNPKSSKEDKKNYGERLKEVQETKKEVSEVKGSLGNQKKEKEEQKDNLEQKQEKEQTKQNANKPKPPPI